MVEIKGIVIESANKKTLQQPGADGGWGVGGGGGVGFWLELRIKV